MRIEIDAAQDGKTIGQLLRLELKFSSKMIKYVKYRPDGILVNGEWRTVRYLLKKGDILELATGCFFEGERVTRLPSLPTRYYPITAGVLYAEALFRALGV